MNMQEYFKKGGPVDQAMREAYEADPRPGKEPYQYRRREEQVRYAERVYACLEGGSQDQGDPTHILAIEAETGVGKTIGATIPLIDRLARHLMAGETDQARGALSTYTIALRRQIAGKDLPVAIRAVQMATGQEIDVAEYWGATSFVSMRAVVNIMDELKARKALLAAEEVVEAVAIDRDVEILNKILVWWFSDALADALKVLKDEKDAPKSLPFAHGSTLMFEVKRHFDIVEDQPLLSSVSDKQLMGEYEEVVGYAEYQRLRDRVKEAHLVLMSHAAVLVNGKRQFGLVGKETPLRYLIVDEGHKIPDAAATLAKRSISLYRVGKLLDGLKGVKGIPADARRSAVNSAKALEAALLGACPDDKVLQRQGYSLLYNEKVSGNGDTVQGILDSNDGMLNTLCVALDRLAKTIVIDKVPIIVERARLAANELVRTAVEIKDYRDAMEGGNRYSQVVGVAWSKKEHRPSLLLTAMNPGRLLARYWRRYPGDALAEEVYAGHLSAAVITSATLPAMEDLGLFEGKAPESGQNALPHLPEFGWQIPPHIHGSLRSPERVEPLGHFGDMAFVLTPGSVSQTMLHGDDAIVDEDDEHRYVNPEWEEEHLVPMIKAMVDAMGPTDRAIILTPSYKDIENMMTLLGGTKYERRMMPQTRDIPMLAMAKKYARPDSVGKVLISTGGWEGIDLPGMVQHLMIARVPRPPVDEIIRRACLRKYGKDLANRILFYRINRATINKFRQGIGRCIRKHDDRATLWIADSRMGVPWEVLDTRDIRVMGSHMVSAYSAVIPDRFVEDFQEARLFTKKDGLFVPGDGAAPSNRAAPGGIGPDHPSAPRSPMPGGAALPGAALNVKSRAERLGRLLG